ncbi:MAG: rod shape-determining protein MreD, partial [Chloroflexota bacterium]
YLLTSLPILILAAAAQASIVPQIRILGGGPDLVFLAVLSWSVHAKFDEALTWAFVGGIIQDLLSAAPMGTSAMGLIVVIFIVHLLNQGLYRVGFLLLTMLVVTGTVIKEFVFALVMTLVGMGGDLVNTFSYVILPTTLYNLVLIAPAYIILRQIQKRLAREKRVFY